MNPLVKIILFNHPFHRGTDRTGMGNGANQVGYQDAFREANEFFQAGSIKKQYVPTSNQ